MVRPFLPRSTMMMAAGPEDAVARRAWRAAVRMVTPGSR